MQDIMSSAKQTYEHEKREEEVFKKTQEEKEKIVIWEFKKRTLEKALWNILGISIDPENIRNIDVDTSISMYPNAQYVPAITVDGICFVYDANFDQDHLWDHKGLRVWGKCNKYNGFKSPCLRLGLSKIIRSRLDLGEILSEGIKADHYCRVRASIWGRLFGGPMSYYNF